ncbi:zinc-binding dehydrogenase [Taibaiella soli]|uniref:alcohol dehydrogenase n=1 Tax=Taibaiella soli TaxID=1649169 RepID=A0A2W2AVZ9_9BACT|nr:zinc-binding dehydrogenase [Taibaiella soli]PZF71858.1 alcohol dehydrogenase [Taibaiella soli]
MSKTGNIVVFEGPGMPLQLQSRELRAIQPDEVLVKNVYTTICGSDLHTYSGVRKEACPTVLGHEIAGRVEEIGSGHSGMDDAGNTLQVGDIVTWSVFASDPESLYSLQGMPQKGAQLFKYGHAQITETEAFHGGLAEYCILKKGTAILKVPETMPLPVVATINCAIATVAGALRLAGDLNGKTVLITGMGLLGITCAAMCREAGAVKVIAADVDDQRLETAKAFGANECVNLRTANTIRASDVNVSFDMSGAPDAIEYGLNALTTGGTAVWVGSVFNTRAIQVNPEKMIRGLLTIKGLHNYNYEDFRYAVDFMSAHWEDYPFGKVVAEEFALPQAQQAFEYALAHKPLRVGVRID